MAVLLIVEDDTATNEAICEYMRSAGHITLSALDGEQGLQIAREKSVDLVVLDIMLPKRTGLEVLKELRQTSNIPILMLTALDDEPTQAASFDEQADDYITKPFSMPLVVRRIEAVLRRTDRKNEASTVIRYKDICLNAESYEVSVGETGITLTAREFEILKLFLENQGRVFTRDNLLNSIWGYDYFGDEKIENTHIKNIRRKLGVDYIETIRGGGYKIEKEN